MSCQHPCLMPVNIIVWCPCCNCPGFDDRKSVKWPSDFLCLLLGCWDRFWWMQCLVFKSGQGFCGEWFWDAKQRLRQLFVLDRFSGQRNAKPGQGMVGQRVKMIVYGLVVAVEIGQKNSRMPRARQGWEWGNEWRLFWCAARVFKVWQKNTRQGKVLVGSFCLWQKKQGEGKLVGVDKVLTGKMQGQVILNLSWKV